MIGNSGMRLFLSAFFLVMATVLAVLSPASVGFLWQFALIAFLAAGFSAFLKSYRSYLLVRFVAQESLEISSSLLPSPILAVGGTNLLQMVISPMRYALGKAIGAGYFLASKLFEVLILLSATAVSIFYLIFVHFGRTNPSLFIGVWIVLLGFLFLFMERLPFLHGLASWRAFSLTLLDVSSWLMDVISVWLFLFSFGYWISPANLFLPFSIILLLAKISPVFYGFGQNEILGQVLLAVFGLPLFPAFLAVFFWDVSKIAVSFLLTESWRKLEERRALASLV